MPSSLTRDIVMSSSYVICPTNSQKTLNTFLIYRKQKSLKVKKKQPEVCYVYPMNDFLTNVSVINFLHHPFLQNFLSVAEMFTCVNVNK